MLSAHCLKHTIVGQASLSRRTELIKGREEKTHILTWHTLRRNNRTVSNATATEVAFNQL